MTAGLGRGIALAGTGVVVGLAIVAALFGSGEFLKRVRGFVTPGEASRPLADLPPGSERPAAKTDRPRADGGDQAAIDSGNSPLAGPDRSPQAQTRQAGEQTPSLDILRVEPSGDTVLAGRGAPKAAIELLRDNQTVARVTADESGQFAIDSLALPPGNSELTLRSTAPDGSTAQGKASAVVVVDKDLKAQPLVAVSEPDRPTRVLSMPGPTANADKEAGKEAPKGAGKSPEKTEPPPRREAALPGAGSKSDNPAAASAQVKIVSVDAQEGGRLFVSGQGGAWASLRLYLNDTLVASGRAGADGRVAFTIGRGVRPGGYQIRIDQVDAESGKVAGRAQVGFNVPVQLAAKEPAKEGAKTASKETPASSAKPEAQAGAPAGKPAATPPTAATPPSSAAPSMASGNARPGPGSLETDRRAAEALSPRLPEAAEAPVGDAKTATPPTGPAAAEDLSAKPAGAPPRLAETPSTAPPASDMAATPPAPAPGSQPVTVFVPEIDTAKITRGDNLWQISRRSYGDGRRYTVIYDANREQIRDPNLIYPGQIFVMPKESPAASGQPAKRG